MGYKILVAVFVILCFEYLRAQNENLWYSYQFGSGVGNREVLRISDLKANDNFTFGKNVTHWKAIALNDKAYAVGIMPFAVIVITIELKRDTFSYTEKLIDIRGVPTDIELMITWSADLGKKEVILIVAAVDTFSQIHWYKITDDEPQNFWNWKLHSKVYHLNHLEIEGRNRLITITTHDTNSTYLEIYEFTLDHNAYNFWLRQNIHLSCSPKITADINVGTETYLAVPQRDIKTVYVYKHIKDHFILYKNVTNSNIQSVSTFKIGAKGFLAVGGYTSGLYKFTGKGLVKERIPDLNLEDIQLWFPVPVKTYRDEVLIILQRTLFHGTHNSFSFEALVFDGRHFTFHDEMSCLYYGEEFRGLSCLADEEHDMGISGAATFTIRNKFFMLVPRRQSHSALFEVETQLKPVPSPAEVEVQKLKATKKKLEELIAKQLYDSKASTEEQKAELETENPQISDNEQRLQSSEDTSETDNQSIPGLARNLEAVDLDISDLRRKLSLATKEIAEIFEQLKDVVTTHQNEIHLKELTVNGMLEVRGESEFKSVSVNKFNGQPAHAVFSDIVNINDIRPIETPKTFNHLEAENIIFHNINHVPAEDIAYNDGEPLIIRGDIKFQKYVAVNGDVNVISGKVNDISLKDEIVTPDTFIDGHLKFTELHATDNVYAQELNGVPIDQNRTTFDDHGPLEVHLVFDNLYLPGNITVEDINGINFNEFVESLCFKNKECQITEDIFIDGQLKVDQAEIGYLNDIKFPDEYVLRTSKDFITISGPKYFDNSLIANEIIAHNTINGMDPKGIITLSSNQTLPGKFIFSNLEVLEGLTIKGKVHSPQVDNDLENPTLLESNELRSNVIFKHLEVEGSIMVSGKFNGIPFEALLDDVVYKDKQKEVITSVKKFPKGFTIRNGLNLLSNSINDIPLPSFVTKDTEQELVISTLNGNVTFENLHLLGLYGNINITELDQEAVKLSGEQFISAELIFENEDPESIDILATELEISETLNGKYIEDYLSPNEILKVLVSEMQDVVADVVEVDGSFTGEIANFDLENFDETRLSLTRDQIIDGHYTLKQADIDSIKADYVNNVSYSSLFMIHSYTDHIVNQLLKGKLKIEELEIRKLEVDSINEVDMRNIHFEDDFIVRNSSFQKDLKIEKDAYFQHLKIENFNQVSFDLFANNIVYKDEEDIVITGFKVFANGFHVAEQIFTEHINGIHIDDILTKQEQQEVLAPIHIYGDVLVTTDCDIEKNLNDIPIGHLSKVFEVHNGIYSVQGDVTFNHPVYVDRLYLDGPINGLRFATVVNRLTGTQKNSSYFGNVTFKGPVLIKGNLMSEYINDIDFSEFVDSIVFKNEDTPVYGVVIFTEEVNILNTLHSYHNLDSRFVCGIDLESWKNDVAFVDRGCIHGTVSFENVELNENLQAKRINNITMDSLILTRTDETLDVDLEFEEVSFHSDVSVGGLVNGHILEEEYENTVMSEGVQEIESKVIFRNNVLVRENLDTYGKVNGMDLRKIVTTNTDQNLTGTYDFLGEVTVSSNLYSAGLVNNIDIDKWEELGVKGFANYTQNIYDEWNVDGEIIFKADVSGKGLISGINVVETMKELQHKHELRHSSEKYLMANYQNTCEDVNYIMELARKQVYFFKYFEELQHITFSQPIRHVHHLQYRDNHHLLVTEEGSCATLLYSWEKSEFLLSVRVEIGSVSQIIPVNVNTSLLLVINSEYESNCPIQGANIWKFEQENFVLVHTMEDHILLQSSLIPRTFYGLTGDGVYEYLIETDFDVVVKRVRKWEINSKENLAFLPRGAGIGLAVYNGNKLFRLIRDSIAFTHYGYDTEAIILGRVIESENHYLPRYDGNSNVQIIHAGFAETKRTLVAVASHEETTVKSRLDTVKIYEDIVSGKLFHKVPAYKPSSLTTIEFGSNGETLLIFLEDNKDLQVYEYKGIEGFKSRMTIKLPGRKLINFFIEDSDKLDKQMLLVVDELKLYLLEVITEGNQLQESDVDCNL